MNIQRIYSAKFNITPSMSRAGFNNSQYGVRMAKPLSVDTVSFNGKMPKISVREAAAKARKEARALRDAKLVAESKKAPDTAGPTKKNLSGEERKQGVSISTARQIREMILKSQKQIDNFMERIFGDLVVTESEPKNPILKMSGRAKSDVSIMEKSSTRDWNSINEILENMTDLNGRKTVFNYKTGKKEAEIVLDRFIPLIKTKQIVLKEIELQRPKAIEIHNPKTIESFYKKEQEEFDYVSKTFLDKLEDAQEEVINGLETNPDKIQLVDRPLPRYTKGNYCALHLILQSTEKGSRPFELQIMGAKMSDGKAFDDKRFKFFDGKQLDKMYAPLIDLWRRLLPEENAAAKDRFLQYCKDANIQLREDELQECKTQRHINRSTGLFKTVRNYGLPPEYDLNYQYELMRKCEKEAKLAQKDTSVPIKLGEKIENKIIYIEKRFADATKEKLQKIVAKYTPKQTKSNKDKSKIK